MRDRKPLPQNRLESLKLTGEENDPVGIVVRIQRFSLDDGPGIRTTVFLKGCPLKCSWCSNPETQKPQVEITWNKKLCDPECYDCLESCVEGALSRRETRIRFDPSKCTSCWKCVEVCRKKALVKIGEIMHVSSVMNEVKKDTPFYEKSGGGLTISGGEPMYQAEFAQELARRCCFEGISVVLDTCGFADWASLSSIDPFINLYLFDIKHMDAVVHKQLTGVDNTIILKNLKEICKLGTPIILRMPVIPGINDSNENLEALAHLAIDTKNVTCVNLLPYHRLGIGKYEGLGLEYTLNNLEKPSKEYLERVRDKIESIGVCVKILE